MVKYDNAVKQHQVNIAEIIVFQFGKVECRLSVMDVVVREIADQTAGKRRHIRQLRAFVGSQDLTDSLARMGDGAVFFGCQLVLLAGADF